MYLQIKLQIINYTTKLNIALQLELVNWHNKLIVDEIGERHAHEIPITNHAMVVKLYHFCMQFPATFAYLIGESQLFRRIVTFLVITPS